MGKLWVKSLETRKTTRLRLEEDHIDLPSARWDIPITGSYCWGAWQPRQQRTIGWTGGRRSHPSGCGRAVLPEMRQGWEGWPIVVAGRQGGRWTFSLRRTAQSLAYAFLSQMLLDRAISSDDTGVDGSVA